MRSTLLLLFFLSLTGIGLSTVANGQSIFMLHRGSEANNFVASIMEIDLDGNLIDQWTTPVVRTDPDHIYLSSIATRRYMSQSLDGNLLTFNSFADGSVKKPAAFDLNTRTFDTSTIYTGPSTLRSVATVDGSGYWLSGLTGINGIRYVEGGTSSPSVGITSNTGAREQLLFHNNRMWVSRQSGDHGVSFLDLPPGEFPTTASSEDLTLLTGSGWDTNDGEYQAFTFLGDDTLFVGTQEGTGSADSRLLTFIHDPDAPSLSEGWNRLELDQLNTGGQVIGVSTLVDPDSGDIYVFYNTPSQIWKTIYNPAAEEGEKFSTPEMFASDLLGDDGEVWGGVVAVVPEPALAWLFGLFSLTAALVWRRQKRQLNS